ncbi:MAG: lipid-A-disaccharide synthase N-terminal domain-containing protein [Desulfobacteraceae bacterium]|nr:lipid-A-disaccharide synthase N-terminal domain-containing protein [Desulfobacteraceae bacterium]
MDSDGVQHLVRWCLDNYLLIFGFIGQAFFSGRFLAQWIASERQGKSVVPLSFWYLSVGGGGMLLIYAILRKDPVFILGQGGGLLIYLRNLYLIHKQRFREKSQTT